MKRKIAILGGGIAGLAAAYELSKTAELREAYCVTIYQMGWRLGGKCASGRNADGRIEEHGLHVWFGCYENAFRMLRDVYASWRKGPDNPLRDWTDAIKPHSFTPLGEFEAGNFFWWNLKWPPYPGTPGDGSIFPSGWAIVKKLISLITRLIHSDDYLRDFAINDRRALKDAVALLSLIYDSSLEGAVGGKRTVTVTIGGLADVACNLPDQCTDSRSDELTRSHMALSGLLEILERSIVSAGKTKPLSLLLIETVDIGIALARGIIADVLMGSEDRRRSLSDIEFRDWLVAHGAKRAHVSHSTVLRCLYDTAMQYTNGDCTSPDMAAVTGVIVSVRFLCTTKGSMLWRLETGMGEAVIAPIYEVLKDRGVSVEFFRRVEDIEVSSDGTRVIRIRLARQAEVTTEPYEPIDTLHGRPGVEGMRYWPAEPFWAQIVNGSDLKKRHVNFESHWCGEKPTGYDPLVVDKDFHDVVIAISVGEFKVLNGDKSLAQAVLDTDPGFLKMTQQISLIPTQSFQFWCNKNLQDLGWQHLSPAAVGWAPAFNIWADMTQTLKHEPAGPASVQYFCGPYHTLLYTKSRTDQTVPGTGQQEVFSQAVDWFTRNGLVFLPGTGTQKKVDWNFLYVTDGSSGQARVARQWLRANIDPTECIPSSATGSIDWRISAHGPKAKNLFVAGCWIRTGFEVSCVEGAVMAGMQAARAISGSPQEITGEDLFQLRPRN